MSLSLACNDDRHVSVHVTENIESCFGRNSSVEGVKQD